MRVAPISFQKTLVKNCTIPDNKHRLNSCAIYKLDLPEDIDYFSKAQCDRKWTDNRFLDEVESCFQCAIEEENNYVLENKKGDCLGYICTSDDSKNKIKEIMFLETCPAYAKSNPKRGMKYIGETLLSYAVELADKEGFECVSIPIASTKATSFYVDKCGFKENENDPMEKTLSKKDFYKLIKQNQEHTNIKEEQKNIFSVFKIQKRRK